MKRFFHEFLTNVHKKNILPKFISILLAVVLWAYLSSGNRGVELQFRVAIVVENLPRNMAISKLSSEFVTVVVNGKADLLKGVHSNNIKAVLDLRDSKTGLAWYPIQIVRNEIPESINVSSKQSLVEVSIETRASKTLKIAPLITGSVANGFSAGTVRVSPDTVRVTGPGSILAGLTKVDTSEIHVDGAEQDIITDVSIKTESLDLLKFDVNMVQVVIPVISKGAFLDFTVPIDIKHSTKYKVNLLDANTATIRMKGNAVVSAADDMNIGAVIYLDSATVEKLIKNKKRVVQKFPVSVVYNKNIYDLEVLSVSPEETSVSIAVK